MSDAAATPVAAPEAPAAATAIEGSAGAEEIVVDAGQEGEDDTLLALATGEVLVDMNEPEAEAPPAEAAGEQEAEGEAEVTPEAEGEAPKAEAATPEKPPAKEETPAKGKPFGFRVDGKRVDVAGAEEFDDKIVVTKDAWQRQVQPYLAHRPAILERERLLQRRIEELNPDSNETVVKARTLIEAVSKDVLGSKENLESFLSDYDKNLALLQAKIDNAVLQAKDEERGKRDAAAASEAQVKAWSQMMADDMPQAVDVLLDGAKAKGFDLPSDVAESFKRRVFNEPGRFYVLGTERNAQETGLRPGELGRNDAALATELAHVIEVHQATAKRFEDAKKKAKEAEKKNAAALGKDKQPPAVPAPKGGAAPAAKPTPSGPQYKTREEWRRAHGSY